MQLNVLLSDYVIGGFEQFNEKDVAECLKRLRESIADRKNEYEGKRIRLVISLSAQCDAMDVNLQAITNGPTQCVLKDGMSLIRGEGA